MIGDGSHPTLPCPISTTTISACSLTHLTGPEYHNRVKVQYWPAFATSVGWVVFAAILSLKCTEKRGGIMSWTVYLSGEIHTDWRQQIITGSQTAGLAVTFTSAVTDHQASDAAGDVLGEQAQPFWRDHQSAKVNAIRGRTHIQKCDLAVIRFGDQYKQWNAAFDAGFCAALGKPYITLHSDDIVHPLKEVDAAAMAWATTSEQVVEILKYVVAK